MPSANRPTGPAAVPAALAGKPFLVARLLRRLLPWRRWLAGSALALLGLPYLALAFFNYPYWDDYAFAVLVRQQGLWAAQAHYYTTWTGRYFGTLLQTAANPLTYGWEAGLPLVPLGALAATLLAQALALRTLASLPWRRAWGWSAGLLLAQLYTMPSPYSGFYWFASVVIYQVGAVLFLVFPVAVVRSLRASRAVGRVAWYGLALSCVAALAGTNELTLLLAIWLLGWLSWLSYRRGHSAALGRWLGLLLVALAGGAVLVAAPGNLVRLAQDAPAAPPALWRLGARAAGQTIFFLTEPRQLTALVVLPVLLARLGYRYRGARPAGLRLAPGPGLLLLGGGIGLAMLLLCRVGWGYPATRILNLLWFWLLTGWLLVLWAALPASGPARPGAWLRRLRLPVWLYVALLAGGGTERAAWRELLENAPAWQRQQRARTLAIRAAHRAGAREVSVAPLHDVRPHGVLLLGETLSPAASARPNQDAAAWYGLDSLRLSRPGPLAPANVNQQ
jgi:hypothetical protein